VDTLNHPTPSLESSLAFDGLGFLSTWTDVCSELELVSEIAYLLVVVAFVQTKPLRSCLSGRGTFYGHTLKGFTRQFEVVPVGTVDCEADRDPGGVR
jgi:hypothetical protein